MATPRSSSVEGRLRRRGKSMSASMAVDETERYYDLKDTLNEQIATQRGETVALSGKVESVQGQLTNIYTKLDLLASKMEQSQKTNWPVIGLLVTIILAIIPGGWFVVTNAVSNAILPVQSSVAQINVADVERDRKIDNITQANMSQSRDIASLQQTLSVSSEATKHHTEELSTLMSNSLASSTSDSASRTDRQQLNERLRVLEAAVSNGTADRKNQSGEMGARLLEMEQQFASVSTLENLRWSQQQSFNSLEFEKTHPGERYPAINYFPTSIFQSVPPPLSGSR